MLFIKLIWSKTKSYITDQNQFIFGWLEEGYKSNLWAHTKIRMGDMNQV